MNCEHNKTIGDNYGVTCQECGETLQGYGYNLSGSRKCLHVWGKISAEEEQCMYCEAVREREKKAN